MPTDEGTTRLDVLEFEPGAPPVLPGVEAEVAAALAEFVPLVPSLPPGVVPASKGIDGLIMDMRVLTEGLASL